MAQVLIPLLYPLSYGRFSLPVGIEPTTIGLVEVTHAFTTPQTCTAKLLSSRAMLSVRTHSQRRHGKPRLFTEWLTAREIPREEPAFTGEGSRTPALRLDQK